MNIAMQLQHVMGIIWNDGDDSAPSIVALASYVKTHNRRNPENVFEVIDILWPNDVKTLVQRIGEEANRADHYIVDVKFTDESQCLIECQNGVGHSVEFIS